MNDEQIGWVCVGLIVAAELVLTYVIFWHLL